LNLEPIPIIQDSIFLRSFLTFYSGQRQEVHKFKASLDKTSISKKIARPHLKKNLTVFYFLLLLYWGYIVTFTKVLTMYLQKIMIIIIWAEAFPQ
jgi:hypothetical protein